MWIKTKMFVRSIKSDKRKYISYLFVILFFIWIWLYAFNSYRIYDTNNKISNIQNNINIKKSEYNSITDRDDYKRLETAIYFERNKRTNSWIDTLQSLINVFDTISSIWDESSIILEDFIVNMTEVRLKWSVDDLRTVYTENWLITSFQELEFIETISIPSYSQRWNVYQFDLTSKIKINDRR